MSERAFKVGDRVLVGESPKWLGDGWVDPEFAGKVGTISHLGNDGDCEVRVGAEYQYILREHLTPLGEEPEAGEPLPARSATLRTADGLVNGDRQDEYGTPDVNLGRIATLWGVIFGHEVTKSEVALALACLKVARLVQTPWSRDGWVDLAGYAAIGAEVSES